jgi:hypothetical protein
MTHHGAGNASSGRPANGSAGICHGDRGIGISDSPKPAMESVQGRVGFMVSVLMRRMSQARGRGVGLRVTQISPGVVETEFDVVMTYGNKEHAQER